MTRRYDIVKGDTTTTGGVVLGGDSNDTLNGREQAYENDPVWCPVCKTVGRIVCTGKRWSMTGPDGREAALSDDLCVSMQSCPATYSVAGCLIRRFVTC